MSNIHGGHWEIKDADGDETKLEDLEDEIHDLYPFNDGGLKDYVGQYDDVDQKPNDVDPDSDFHVPVKKYVPVTLEK